MKISITALFLICSFASASPAGPSGVKDVYQKSFAIGAAIPSPRLSTGEIGLLKRNFSSITAENLMKPKYLQPAEGHFDFGAADQFVDFAKSNRLDVHGHTLVWHNQCPEWFFKDGDKPASRERVLERLNTHVSTIVGRYKGRIKSWDVVNEAIDNDTSNNDLRKSQWFLATGGDYIEEAFRAARRADPEAILYYNDFDIEQPVKREKTLRLIRSLKAKKVPLDGIGIQGHWSLDRINLKDIEAAIIAFHAEGLRVSITELDMNVVTEKGGDPFAQGCPPGVLLKQAEQYAGLFRLFHKHADKMDRVTFWGLHDGRSWLNHSPRKRTNHPLLWARDLSAKPALQSVMNATADPVLILDSEQSKPNIIVFYTDDHGFADLGVNGSVTDIKTPNIDALARSGVLAKNGYSTAPQCVPSRAGLLVGRFQSRFGVEANGQSLEGFDKSTTIAERLRENGYITAQFGKWHLGPNSQIVDHGFKHVFSHAGQPKFAANITLDGKDRPMAEITSNLYHIDGCSKAAAAIIERYKNDPFFLYIAYRAPHTPLDAPKSYTDRFPGEMPGRRRQALGMISAVDDGVGLITATLRKHKLSERTLIFMIGDNGAPLKIHKVDSPVQGDPGGWDGSLNSPMNGEKGMLAEGGIHVPFVVAWPGTIPAGQTYEHPITALDVAATAVALANIQTSPGDLDGKNIIPHLKGEIKTPPHDTLYWRWIAQSAIREGNWKLLRGGDREYLFDLSTDIGEKQNLAAKNPEIANRLRDKLQAWGRELNPPGLATGRMAPAWNGYFDHYLEGKTITVPPESKNKKPRAARKNAKLPE